MISGESADKKGAEERQVNERVRTMSARDFGRKIDSIDDTHATILNSLIDSVPENYPVRKRQKLEKDLNSAYQKYFNLLAEIEKILK